MVKLYDTDCEKSRKDNTNDPAEPPNKMTSPLAVIRTGRYLSERQSEYFIVF